MVVNTEVQNGPCVKYSILGDNDWLSDIFIWIYKIIINWMLFAVFTWTTTAAKQKIKTW